MKKNSKTEALNETIVLLQNKQAIEFKLLKQQFQCTYESLKPINLIKRTIHDLSTSPDIREDLVANAIGLATGYLTKKIIVGESHSPVKKILGLFLQFVIANFVTKHAATIKTAGDNILHFVADFIGNEPLETNTNENKEITKNILTNTQV